MGGILVTLTRPSGSGDLLACSMRWLMLERGMVVVDRFYDVSNFRPFVQAQCDFPSLSVLGSVEGTISESPHRGIQTSLRRNERL